MPRRSGESPSRITRDDKGPIAQSTGCSWPFVPTSSEHNAERPFTAGLSPAVRSPAERSFRSARLLLAGAGRHDGHDFVALTAFCS